MSHVTLLFELLLSNQNDTQEKLRAEIEVVRNGSESAAKYGMLFRFHRAQV